MSGHAERRAALMAEAHRTWTELLREQGAHAEAARMDRAWAKRERRMAKRRAAQ